MVEAQECRVYLDHLRAEHLRIQRMLRQIREALQAQETTPGESQFSVIAENLRNLRTELANHFREEEGGGCMEEAVAFNPHLSAEVRLVEAQHPLLLAAVDTLIMRVAQPSVMQQIEPLRQELDDLAMLLTRHEEAETGVLERGFGVYLEDEPLRPD